MATNTGAFFAGIGTTFIVIALGFGGGLMMAKSALKEPSGYQTRAATHEASGSVRVILPTSAEAAQPPQPAQQAALPLVAAMQPAIQPLKEVQAPVEKQFEKADTKKLEAEERERKRRYAERKARRQDEARAQQQREQHQPRERENARILAFGDDSTGRSGGGFFGN